MKNLFLVTFLFITICCKAQTTKPIDGFLGVKFGASSAQVIEALKAKGGSLNTDQTPQSIGFSNIKLGGRPVSTLFVHFVNDKAYEAVFIFTPEQEPKIIDYYNAVVKDISDVYGVGKTKKKFKAPYTEGDGYEITAIKTGNADYETDWVDGVNYIIALIRKDTKINALTVRLFYNDGKLRKEFTDQQKAQNKSEF